MDLARDIRRFRRQHHISQEDLADTLRVSPTTVSRWERGVQEPDLRAARKLYRLIAGRHGAAEDDFWQDAAGDDATLLHRLQTDRRAVLWIDPDDDHRFLGFSRGHRLADPESDQDSLIGRSSRFKWRDWDHALMDRYPVDVQFDGAIRLLRCLRPVQTDELGPQRQDQLHALFGDLDIVLDLEVHPTRLQDGRRITVVAHRMLPARLAVALRRERAEVEVLLRSDG